MQVSMRFPSVTAYLQRLNKLRRDEIVLQPWLLVQLFFAKRDLPHATCDAASAKASSAVLYYMQVRAQTFATEASSVSHVAGKLGNVESVRLVSADNRPKVESFG